MEAVLGGPLHLHVHRVGGLGATICRTYAAQLVSALLHMASQGCIHRDIKASNCVLNEHGHIKICDFGSAIALCCSSSEARTYTVIGTAHVMAPEMMCLYEHPPYSAVGGRGGYGVSVDWWALGVLLQEMLFAYLPTELEIASLQSLPLEYVLSSCTDESREGPLPPLVDNNPGTCCESCTRQHPPNFFDVCLRGHSISAEDDSGLVAHATCLIKQLLSYEVTKRLGPRQQDKVGVYQ